MCTQMPLDQAELLYTRAYQQALLEQQSQWAERQRQAGGGSGASSSSSSSNGAVPALNKLALGASGTAGKAMDKALRLMAGGRVSAPAHTSSCVLQLATMNFQ